MPPKKRDKDNESTKNSKIDHLQADHELFLQAFEKPTQIYRFLRTRNMLSPIFLNRTLSYMKRRMSRSNKSRVGFKVDSLLEKITLKKNTELQPNSLGGYMTLTFLGFYDKSLVDPRDYQVKVETLLLKICHKKRKESSSAIMEVSVGSCSLPLNPSTSEPPAMASAVSIASDTFSPSHGPNVKSYMLMLRVTVTRISGNTPNGSSSSTEIMNGDSQEPATKRLKSSDHHNSTPDNKWSKLYGSELIVYDKHNRCLLTNGEYDLVLHDATPGGRSATIARSPHKALMAQWETIPNENDIQTDLNPFDIFKVRPLLKLKLSWSHEPTNGLVNRPKLYQQTETNGARKDSVTTRERPSSSQQNSNENGKHGKSLDKLKLSWSHVPTNGLVNRPKLYQQTETNGARKDSVTTRERPSSSQQNLNENGKHGKSLDKLKLSWGHEPTNGLVNRPKLYQQMETYGARKDSVTTREGPSSSQQNSNENGKHGKSLDKLKLSWGHEPTNGLVNRPKLYQQMETYGARKDSVTTREGPSSSQQNSNENGKHGKSLDKLKLSWSHEPTNGLVNRSKLYQQTETNGARKDSVTTRERPSSRQQNSNENCKHGKSLDKLKLSWSHEPTNGLVNRPKLYQQTETNGARKDSVTTRERPSSSQQNSNENDKHGEKSKSDSSEDNKRQQIIYQFLYNNNSRQQTEACDDLHCPWCSLDCGTLYSLLKHLKLCHSRFNFTYFPIPGGARIDVSINELYDGSYTGSPHDLIAAQGRSGCAGPRAGPTRRTSLTRVLIWRPRARRRPQRHSLSEFLELDDSELVEAQRPYLTGHNRLYHHTITCLPVYPNELDIDSENETDPLWLQQKTMMMIDEFTDVNEGEKELMKMWNLHVMKYNFVGDCQIPLACQMFLQKKGKELLQKNLYRNFILHMCSLHDFGLLSPVALYQTLQMLNQMLADSTEAKEKMRESLKAQREHWNAIGKFQQPVIIEQKPQNNTAKLNVEASPSVRRKTSTMNNRMNNGNSYKNAPSTSNGDTKRKMSSGSIQNRKRSSISERKRSV